MEPSSEEEKPSVLCDNSIADDTIQLHEQVDFTAEFTTDMVFNTRSDLIKWAQQVGRNVGMVVVIKKSDGRIIGRSPRLILGCERGGEYREAKKGSGKAPFTRQTSTKRCGCPFLLKGIKVPDCDEWTIKVECGMHNHKMDKHFQGHSYAGKLNEEEQELLVELSKSGVRPRDALRKLKERDSKNASTLMTIYNVRSKMKVIDMAGRFQMQHLLAKLDECGYIQQHRIDEESHRVKDLFWAHPESIKLAKCFPNLFLLDCTYKTNRYRMPLLQIIGITSTEKTFAVAFAYIEREKEDNYVWTLECLKTIIDPNFLPYVLVTDLETTLMNAIRIVFPDAQNIICRYHISRNLLTNCKKLFATKEAWDEFLSHWNILVCSPTEQEFLERLSSFEIAYSGHPDALSYVKDVWLTKYKEHFISAWIDQYCHFGNDAMNKAESSHARLKKYLGTCRHDFTKSWETINKLLSLQFEDINASFKKSFSTAINDYRSETFNELRGFLSRPALDLIAAEEKRAQAAGLEGDLCMHLIRRTHGLPCAHEIAEYQREGFPIPLSCIHPHWKLSSVPIDGISTTEQELEVEFLMIAKRYQQANDDERREILRKLKELGSPECNSLYEPATKKSTRAQPSTGSAKRLSQAESSTRPDMSAFEYVDGIIDQQSPIIKRRKKLEFPVEFLNL